MPRPASVNLNVESLTDQQLLRLRVALEQEMRRRKLSYSVGDIGEQLVIDFYRETAGLPNLQRAPRGTKNVDALSRNGERYSIKTLWNAKKTGTIYPDPEDRDKQLFERLLIVRLTPELGLSAIYELSWHDFLRVRSWDKRMNAWYVGVSQKTFASVKTLLPAAAADTADANDPAN